MNARKRIGFPRNLSRLATSQRRGSAWQRRLAVVLMLTAAGASPFFASCGHNRQSEALGKIAYVEHGALWTKTLPSGAPRQVVTTGDVSAPRWSPSGQWLSYRTSDEYWVAREDGAAARKLPADPIWASGTDDLATGGDEVRTQHVDGSGVRTLVAPRPASDSATSFHDLAWSSGGGWLAYVERVVSNGPTPQYLRERLMKIRSDGTDSTVLYDPGSPAPEGIGVRGWSPDDRQLLFWTYPSFSADAADGLALLEIDAAGGKSHGFGYTDDGLLTFATFQSWGVSGQLAVTGGGGRNTWTHKEIRIVEPSGAYHLLTDADTAATEPAFSPDARLVAFVAMPDAGTGVGGGDAARTALAERKIRLIDVSGTNNRQITSDPAYRDEYPQWSTDGSRLLFVRLDAESRASLWMMKLDGSDLHEVLANFAPSTVQSDDPWFGYYGHISWDNVLDWWRGAKEAAPGASPSGDLAATTLPALPAGVGSLAKCPLDSAASCRLAIEIQDALNAGTVTPIVVRTESRSRPCGSLFWALDDDIGCSEPVVETQQSAPVALLLFSGGDCCAMTPARFETELRNWLAASAGGPPWRVYAAVTGNDPDRTVVIANGTAPESRFIEVRIAPEGDVRIRGLTIGTFRTGPYLAQPESLVLWP